MHLVIVCALVVAVISIINAKLKWILLAALKCTFLTVIINHGRGNIENLMRPKLDTCIEAKSICNNQRLKINDVR